MNTLTLFFIAALAMGLALQLWLYRRHARHVADHRGRVPEAFAERISLQDHQKAAEYTLAKVRLGVVDLLLGAVLLLVWTLGGGLELVLGAWSRIGDGAGVIEAHVHDVRRARTDSASPAKPPRQLRDRAHLSRVPRRRRNDRQALSSMSRDRPHQGEEQDLDHRAGGR